MSRSDAREGSSPHGRDAFAARGAQRVEPDPKGRHSPSNLKLALTAQRENWGGLIWKQAVGFFSRLSDNGTAAAVVRHIEPLLKAEELHDQFSPTFDAQEARRTSLRVLGDEPALLGFIVGAVLAFIHVCGGKISDERRNLIMADIWLALFGRRGTDDLFSYMARNQDNPKCAEGMAAGQKIVAYQFGGDYSRDSDAVAAIALGRSLEAVAAGSIRVKNPGDERGQLVGGMMWLHFNTPFSIARRREEPRK